jgi:hypothetical protein
MVLHRPVELAAFIVHVDYYIDGPPLLPIQGTVYDRLVRVRISWPRQQLLSFVEP